jgi:glycosyltransferase involved in cell wall biosynthesis
LDQYRFAFILYRQEEDKYQKILQKLAALKVPVGYEAEFLTISDESNMAAAYNQAMQESDAKYKIYLQPGAYIENIDLLEDLLQLFLRDDQIGIVGISGPEVFLATALTGKAGHNNYSVLREAAMEKERVQWQNSQNLYHEVKVLDGFLLATQYDVVWREDLFSDTNFFTMAQCVEFKRQGYKAVVASQKEAWCSVEQEEKEEDVAAKNIFLEEYSKDIYPLVSILIPTHNRPEYFKIALESALHQTYRNIEIIISDNSDGNQTEKIIQEYLPNKKIHYQRNPGFKFMQNWLWVLENSQGEYFNYLLDDDIFHTNKISRMMDYYLTRDDIAFVTSYRQLIDGNGDDLPDISVTQKICLQDTVFRGEVIAEQTIKTACNFIGEVTTVLLRSNIKECMKKIFLEKKSPINDVYIWLALCQKGNVVYIPEALSYFRQHAGQDQNSLQLHFRGVCDWYDLGVAYDKEHPGRFTQEEYKTLLYWALAQGSLALGQMHMQHSTKGEISEMDEYLLKMAKSLVEANKRKI